MIKTLKLLGFILLLFKGYSIFSQQTNETNSLSLNGTWNIIFDEKNEGKQNGWMNPEIFKSNQGRKSIQVPSAWELSKKDYEGVAFYYHEFNVPTKWNEKVIRLQFDAVNYLSEVWLNGEVVGYHEGGFTPFEFRVDELIKPGEMNVLTIRVVGPIILSDKEIDGVGALETPQWRGGISGGIWQGVRLVATNDIFIEDTFIKPNIQDNTVSLDLNLINTAINTSSANIEIDIVEADKPSEVVAQTNVKKNLHPGGNKYNMKLKIPNVVYWSPDNPHLYKVNVRVTMKGRSSDTWNYKFGMRELTIKDKDFYLNGKPIYIKATFFEGLYPNKIAFPDSEEMARKEIRLAKEAGFNMIRPWRHSPAPMWLDLADEMGIMVVGSPTLEVMGLPLSTPQLPKRVENEISEAILRDRNRTSIVQWELFNELHRPILKQMIRPMVVMARDLDSTRLILDESGGWAFGANMYLPNEYEPTKFNDIHTYPGPFINKRLYDGLLSIGLTEEERKVANLEGNVPGRNVVPGLMSFVSELGYGSLPNLQLNNELFQKKGNPLTPAYRYHKRLAKDQEKILKESGFYDMYSDMEQFYINQQEIHGAANKRMIEAVRSNPRIAGYVIHALTAGDWILGAGLLDIWRNPKPKVYESTKAANQPQILTIRTKSHNIYAQNNLDIDVIGINDLSQESIEFQIEIVSVEGDVIFTKIIQKKWKKGISLLFGEKIKTRALQGNYVIYVRAMANDNTILAENSKEVRVFSENELLIPQTKIALLDFNDSLTSLLTKTGVDFKEFDNSIKKSTPVFVNGTPDNEKDKKRIKDLLKFVKEGGSAIYIEGSHKSISKDSTLFPFTANVDNAKGLWTNIPHLVKDHPIFDGLPVNNMMRDEYENVWPTKTLRDLKGKNDIEIESPVASIGFDWFSKDHELGYSGPGKSWWGSDMAILSIGKGTFLISQFRLVENLDKDPVADKIFFNLINYMTKN